MTKQKKGETIMKKLQNQAYETPQIRFVTMSHEDLLTTSATGGFPGLEDTFPTPSAGEHMKT